MVDVFTHSSLETKLVLLVFSLKRRQRAVSFCRPIQKHRPGPINYCEKSTSADAMQNLHEETAGLHEAEETVSLSFYLFSMLHRVNKVDPRKYERDYHALPWLALACSRQTQEKTVRYFLLCVSDSRMACPPQPAIIWGDAPDSQRGRRMSLLMTLGITDLIKWRESSCRFLQVFINPPGRKATSFNHTK